MKTLTENDRSVVIAYHGGCTDGLCAAWLFGRYFRSLKREYKYIPCYHGVPFSESEVTPLHDLIMVDFSYNDFDTMEHIVNLVENFIVFDHHASAEKVLELLSNKSQVIFNKEKSGAGLAADATDQADLWLPKYVQDRDIWTWKLPDSKAVSAAIQLYPLVKYVDGKEFGPNEETWDSLACKKPEDLVLQGNTVLMYQEKQIEHMLSKATLSKICGFSVMCLNATSLISETGHLICQKYPQYPFSATYYDSGEIRRWSLRSIGNFNVSDIARKMGGGGHKNAAGFETQISLIEIQED